MTLRGDIDALSGRIGAEFNAVRSEMVTGPRTVSYASLAALVPATGRSLDVVTATLTGNPTITPAAGADRQVLRLALYAGGSARTVAVGSSVRLTTGITDRTLSVPSGQVGVLGLEFLAGLGSGGSWVLFAKYATS